MMKNVMLIFVFILMFGTVIYGAEGVPIPPGAELPVPPQVDAQGAILMDFNTGRVLWEKNSTTPLAMASTTKIMTAIVALESGMAGDTVTVSAKAAAAPEVKMHLKTGEEILLGDLLYALMLQSYNDSAIAIAEHIGGDVASFCQMMTQKAKELGALDTVFETPNGLDSGEHHSTAYDMALITRYALNNEEFMAIINTPYKTISSNKSTYNLSNKNRLLNEFDGANGVKTGFTGKAGHCFVGAAKRDDMQLISVVLASGWGDRGKEQKWVDTKRILDYGFQAFDYFTLVNANEVCEDISIERSKTESIDLYFSEEFVLPLTKEEAGSVAVEFDIPEYVKAPVNEGDCIGVAKVYVDGELVKEIDLLTAAAAERHDLKTSIEKVLNSWLEMGTKDQVELILPEFE